MNHLWKNIHPSFKLNGLQYNVARLLEIAKDLEKSGAHYEISIGKFLQQWLDDSDTVIVKTSGSTGIPKDIQLYKTQMITSAKATGVFFKLGENTSALLCLPTNYIAGKMMLVRALVMGWDLHIVAPQKDALTQYDNDYDFVAMVPYQVAYSLKALHKVHKLIIGGGAVSKELNDKLQEVETEVFSTYGMTETITHIAVRRINGLAKSAIYTALPNVKFEKDDRGCLVIQASDILEENIITNDVINLISPTSFKWLGRIDNVINSGGIKRYPEQIEEKLAAFIALPFIITSEEDKELGERIILIFENDGTYKMPNFSEAFSNLSAYERPKKVYTFSKFPFTETGKIKRAEVFELLKENKK